MLQAEFRDKVQSRLLKNVGKYIFRFVGREQYCLLSLGFTEGEMKCNKRENWPLCWFVCLPTTLWPPRQRAAE